MNFESSSNDSGLDRVGLVESAATPRVKASKTSAPGLGEKLAAELKIFEGVVADVRKKLDSSLGFDRRCQQVVEFSAELFGVAPTWVAFFREVLGKGGIMQSLIGEEERKAYMESEQHFQILEMLTTLRSRDLPENDPSESQKMITVRIPACVHDYICDEANALEISVNRLCISRLLQRPDERMIPASQQKRRGRRPGSANNSVSLSSIAPSESQT